MLKIKVSDGEVRIKTTEEILLVRTVEWAVAINAYCNMLPKGERKDFREVLTRLTKSGIVFETEDKFEDDMLDLITQLEEEGIFYEA